MLSRQTSREADIDKERNRRDTPSRWPPMPLRGVQLSQVEMAAGLREAASLPFCTDRKIATLKLYL